MNYSRKQHASVMAFVLLLTCSACSKQQPAPSSPESSATDVVASAAEPAFQRATFDASVMVDNVVQSACFVTSVNSDPPQGVIEVQVGQVVGIEGWTADLDFNVPEEVSFVIKNDQVAYGFPATLGPDRARAAEVLGKPQLANAGYSTQLDLSGVQAGEYEMWIAQTAKAVTKYCHIDNKSLVVR